MKRAICWVHATGEPVDTRFLHEHHRQPRAYRGGDETENLVWLCVGCHDLLHRLSHLAARGKLGIAKDLIAQYLPSRPAAQDRLMILVQEVNQAKRNFEDSIDEKDTVLLTLKIPRVIHSRLKTMASDHIKSNGRKMGLYRYIQNILTQHAVRNYIEGDITDPDKAVDKFIEQRHKKPDPFRRF